MLTSFEQVNVKLQSLLSAVQSSSRATWSRVGNRAVRRPSRTHPGYSSSACGQAPTIVQYSVGGPVCGSDDEWAEAARWFQLAMNGRGDVGRPHSAQLRRVSNWPMFTGFLNSLHFQNSRKDSDSRYKHFDSERGAVAQGGGARLVRGPVRRAPSARRGRSASAADP